MNKLLIIAIVLFLSSCGANKNPHIQISTNFGNIEAELYPDKAPKTVAAFLSYIDSGFYKNSSFYRVLVTESMMSDKNTGVIQGGIWQSNNKKATLLHGIVHESPKQTGLSNTSGTLSLARSTPGTANTEFFICIGDQKAYDLDPDGLGYAAFGKVISGMEIVRKIQEQPATGQNFTSSVVILSIERQ
ncbi:peptidylprolyl isomerase [Ferruginibacter sp.]|nr:peptidylprolyl isomerase [Ferruginibacter sp.]